jgi:hypothetical protein
VGGIGLFALGYLGAQLMRRRGGSADHHEHAGTAQAVDRAHRDTWRMPPLDELPPPKLTFTTRLWMGAMRGYLVIAVGLVIVKVVQIAMH